MTFNVICSFLPSTSTMQIDQFSISLISGVSNVLCYKQHFNIRVTKPLPPFMTLCLRQIPTGGLLDRKEEYVSVHIANLAPERLSPLVLPSAVWKKHACCQTHMLEFPGWRSYQSWLPAPHLTVIRIWMALWKWTKCILFQGWTYPSLHSIHSYIY